MINMAVDSIRKQGERLCIDRYIRNRTLLLSQHFFTKDPGGDSVLPYLFGVRTLDLEVIRDFAFDLQIDTKIKSLALFGYNALHYNEVLYHSILAEGEFQSRFKDLVQGMVDGYATFLEQYPRMERITVEESGMVLEELGLIREVMGMSPANVSPLRSSKAVFQCAHSSAELSKIFRSEAYEYLSPSKDIIWEEMARAKRAPPGSSMRTSYFDDWEYFQSCLPR